MNAVHPRVADRWSPANLGPTVVVAIGVRAAADTLPEELAARETAPRTRRSLQELLIDASRTARCAA